MAKASARQALLTSPRARVDSRLQFDSQWRIKRKTEGYLSFLLFSFRPCYFLGKSEILSRWLRTRTRRMAKTPAPTGVPEKPEERRTTDSLCRALMRKPRSRSEVTTTSSTGGESRSFPRPWSAAEDNRVSSEGENTIRMAPSSENESRIVP